MVYVRRFASIAILLFASACALSLKEPTAVRWTASEAAAPIQVYLPNQALITIPGSAEVYSNGPALTPEEVVRLRLFLEGLRLGFASTAARYDLNFVSQTQVGAQLYVRFQQVLRRHIRSEAYEVPIEGASIVAVISGGRLQRLNSNLMPEPDIGGYFAQPTLQFDFTDSEFAHMIGLLKTNESAAASMRAYLDSIARRTGRAFNFDQFMNRQLSEQREMLNGLFGAMGRTSVLRLLIDLARGHRLSMIRYGRIWMLQARGAFDLPIQFDIELPAGPGAALKIKNLRNDSHKIALIHGFQSPLFPGGKKTEGGESAERAIRRMQQVMNYFAGNFGWTSFGGKNSADEVIVHTALKSLDFRENAAWVGSIRKFIVGEGGGNLYRLDNSISVLGHEFAHAILMHSSALVYRNESGALNEHFADLQGASIEATVEHSGVFDFTVGRDVLTPAVAAEKEKLLELVFTKYGYRNDEIRSFSLDRVALRHFYAPSLSFSTQYDHVKTLREVYTADCQPSIDNDNCGVHTASGVPNKAAALIISALGLEPTRSMFFNTLVYRLNASSTFEDYLVQLYDECLNTPAVAARCDVVLNAFATVGIVHPRLPRNPAPQTPSVAGETPLPLPDRATSPVLKFCGWVDLGPHESVRIFDDRYNAVIVPRNYEVQTKGNYQAVRRSQCACVSGRVTQIPGEKGDLMNALLNVESVEDRADACLLDARIRDKKPPKYVDSGQLKLNPHQYCGWVSVNSASKNVTIIDNRFDVAILASGYPNLTKGNYTDVYQNQCACVIGKISTVTNIKGTTFNYFTELEANGIIPRTYEACTGLQWR